MLQCEFNLKESYIVEHLKIAKNCHLISQKHIDRDSKREDSGKGNGSTKCGISPCYSDKYLREGIRICDFLDSKIVETESKIPIPFIKSLLIDDTYYLNYVWKDKKVLFEGAQGVFLDIDNPVYPNVSSSHVNVGGVIAGTGISFNRMRNAHVTGIVKAYMSSVGVGKFLTEIKNTAPFCTPDKTFVEYKADELREIGGEYGATTGRPRKVGFLDLPMVKYACDTIGVNRLCLTRLDTLLQWCKPKGYIPVCIGYANGAENQMIIEDSISWYDLDFYKPVYKLFPIWNTPSINDKNFKSFIKYIENYTKVRVSLVSIGKNKEDIIDFYKEDIIDFSEIKENDYERDPKL